MATNWTAEQRRAIETPGSLIVSAAAGSGKTAVLTERIARHILEGASPDDLLVVTFTRAAAAEMKKRIGDRLSALAAQQQGDEAARLYGAAEGIGRANISTIDGFCSHVLRRHFDIAGLDPAFRAGEEAENLALRQEALDELMERYYAQKGFSDLVDAFGEEAEFSAQFLRLYDFIMAQPEPMEWLKEAIDKYDIAEDALLGVLTHGAGVEEDEVGVLRLVAQAVADIHQHALDALAVVDVLLAAVAVDEGQRRGVVCAAHQFGGGGVMFKCNILQ